MEDIKFVTFTFTNCIQHSHIFPTLVFSHFANQFNQNLAPHSAPSLALYVPILVSHWSCTLGKPRLPTLTQHIKLFNLVMVRPLLGKQDCEHMQRIKHPQFPSVVKNIEQSPNDSQH